MALCLMKGNSLMTRGVLKGCVDIGDPRRFVRMGTKEKCGSRYYFIVISMIVLLLYTT